MQKKTIITLLAFLGLIVVLTLVSGCGLCAPGSGNLISETKKTDEFHSVETSGSVELYVTQDKGTGHKYHVEAEDNVLPKLEIKTSNGTLKVGTKTGECINPTKPVKIYVLMEEVKALSISGSGKIESQTKITSEELEIKVSGSGNIDMEVDTGKLKTDISGSGKALYRGRATEHTMKVSGSGKLNSFDLATETTKITLSGSGNAEIFASDTLDIKISGSGKVLYRGEATNINQDISGSGKVEKVE